MPITIKVDENIQKEDILSVTFAMEDETEEFAPHQFRSIKKPKATVKIKINEDLKEFKFNLTVEEWENARNLYIDKAIDAIKMGLKNMYNK